MSELREAIAREIREHVKVDATGLAPAVASVFIVGADEAADAILALVSGRMGSSVAESAGSASGATEARHVAGWREIPMTDDVLRYVSRYGGMCRDCADEHGICPASGMPCDTDQEDRAIRHVIKALNYGFRHGYLNPAESRASSPPKACRHSSQDEPLQAARGQKGEGA